jgi:hypothetical protein
MSAGKNLASRLPPRPPRSRRTAAATEKRGGNRAARNAASKNSKLAAGWTRDDSAWQIKPRKSNRASQTIIQVLILTCELSKTVFTVTVNWWRHAPQK